MFPVAVSSLIEVHEVHVDFVIGYFTVVLGCEMTPCFLEACEAVDPHFRGAEGVTPRDDSGALCVMVSVSDNVSDFCVCLCCYFVDDFAGKFAGSVEGVGHFLRSFCDCLKNFGAVKVLASDNKPKFIIFQGHFYSPLMNVVQTGHKIY